MPPQKTLIADSLQPNPDSARLLADLVAMGTVKKGDQSAEWKTISLTVQFFPRLTLKSFGNDSRSLFPKNMVH